jgi:hypothetical protein
MTKEQTPTPPSPENAPQRYIVASRYPDDITSATPYQEAQQLIYEHDELPLSVFRLQYGEPPSMRFEWYVVVLGEQPAEHFDQQFRRILSTGESGTLPEEVIAVLQRRREEMSRQGQWVERHYRMGNRRRID